MRITIVLTLLIVLTSLSACNGTSVGTPEIMPKWPPDRPVLVEAPEVDQDTIDHYRSLMYGGICGFWWEIEPDRKDEAWGAFSAIYIQAKKDNDQSLMSIVIYTMGATRIVEFLPAILEAFTVLEVRSQSIAVYTLGRMPSDFAVYQLIQNLDHENVHVRKAAAYSLGIYIYYDSFPGTRTQAVKGLMLRLKIEEAGWLRVIMEKAIEKLLGDN